jgi:hypothetical protein
MGFERNHAPGVEMNFPEIGTTREGTFFGLMGIPSPWPPSHNVAVGGGQLQDGRIEVWFKRNGKISALLTDNNGNVIAEVESCLLRVTAPTVSLVGVTWQSGNLEIVLNGQFFVASMANKEKVPQEFDVPIDQANKGSCYDFSKENRLAIQRRKERFAGSLGGSAPKPNRYRSGRGEILEALRNEILQIKDLFELINDGALHHAVGLSSIVRKLIVAGDPMPLIQLSAAMTDEPLIVYTASDPRERFPATLSLTTTLLIFNASYQPKMLYENPIDLDVWLELDALQIKGDRLTNRLLLNKIGDTIGAHYDIDARKEILILRYLENFVLYICQAAKLAENLGCQILERSSQSSNPPHPQTPLIR